MTMKDIDEKIKLGWGENTLKKLQALDGKIVEVTGGPVPHIIGKFGWVGLYGIGGNTGAGANVLVNNVYYLIAPENLKLHPAYPPFEHKIMEELK